MTDPSPDPSDTADIELGQHMRDDRPVPAADFRGALGRRLASADPGYGPRPDHLRLRVAAFLAGGGVLIALGILEALGHA